MERSGTDLDSFGHTHWTRLDAVSLTELKKHNLSNLQNMRLFVSAPERWADLLEWDTSLFALPIWVSKSDGPHSGYRRSPRYKIFHEGHSKFPTIRQVGTFCLWLIRR